MCKAGDIILINRYSHNGQTLNKHSFVVIEDSHGEIETVAYDFICNVMSSFHDEEHRKKKLSFPGNIEVSASDESIQNGHGRDGYIKSEQFYYFTKSEISYQRIGELDPKFFNRLLDHIESLDKIEHITENIKTPKSR